MDIELLSEIIKGVDNINKNIDDCMKNGIEFKTFNNKSDGLVFVFRKNSTNEFIELAPSYNNELILQDFKKGKMFISMNFDVKDFGKYCLDFNYGVRFENNEFYYRISILKINNETKEIVDGFLFVSKFKEYKKYLLTQSWKNKREEKLKEAKYKCQLCGKSNTELHVHHNNYDNLCFEEMSDLIVLCKKCHEKFHDIEDI